jgi:hypothetical protein
MPNIDVTELLSDPDFCTTLELQPRNETVGSNGRASACGAWTSFTAVVQQARGRDLIRDDGSSRGSGTIVVYSTLPLTSSIGPSGPDGALAADKLRFRGSIYTVTSVEDWLEYGLGFVKAIAEQDGLA